jgi:hypothetical protein
MDPREAVKALGDKLLSVVFKPRQEKIQHTRPSTPLRRKIK